MSSTTITRVNASDVQVGDIVAGTKAELVAGNGEQVARITEGPGGRVQMRRDGAGRNMIRSSERTTKLWVKRSAAQVAGTGADQARAADAEREGNAKARAAAEKRAARNVAAAVNNPAGADAGTTDKETPMTATTQAPAKPAASDYNWPKDPAEVLADFLVAETSADADAPNQDKPFISPNGLLRFTGTAWRDWLVINGMPAPKSAASKVVLDTGAKMRAFAIPGEGRSKGFYTVPVENLPARVRELGRREVKRAGGKPRSPFGRLTSDQVGVLKSALTSYKPGRSEERKTIRTQLLAHLEALSTEPAADDAGNGAEA